jgi:hypothetical protein
VEEEHPPSERLDTSSAPAASAVTLCSDLGEKVDVFERRRNDRRAQKHNLKPPSVHHEYPDDDLLETICPAFAVTK